MHRARPAGASGRSTQAGRREPPSAAAPRETVSARQRSARGIGHHRRNTDGRRARRDGAPSPDRRSCRTPDRAPAAAPPAHDRGPRRARQPSSHLSLSRAPDCGFAAPIAADQKPQRPIRYGRGGRRIQQRAKRRPARHPCIIAGTRACRLVPDRKHCHQGRLNFSQTGGPFFALPVSVPNISATVRPNGPLQR